MVQKEIADFFVTQASATIILLCVCNAYSAQIGTANNQSEPVLRILL